MSAQGRQSPVATQEKSQLLIPCPSAALWLFFFFVVSLCWEPKGRTVPSDGQLFGGREQLSHEGFNGCNGNGNKGIAATILHKGVKILNLSSSKLPGKRLHPPVLSLLKHS